MIRPYGDHLDDGLVRIEFTLPCSNSNAAIAHAEQMHMLDPEVIHKQALTGEHTHYTLSGVSTIAIDPQTIEPELDPQWMDEGAIETLAASLGRPIRVVAATTGTDTHSVGLDAIVSAKGWNGRQGLSAYRCFDTTNLGRQVANADLIARAQELDADAILVSQTVTQQDLHIANLSQFAALAGPTHRILIVGGAQMTHRKAVMLGFDAGFGKGTSPHQVATVLVRLMCERRIDLVHEQAERAFATNGLEAAA